MALLRWLWVLTAVSSVGLWTVGHARPASTISTSATSSAAIDSAGRPYSTTTISSKTSSVSLRSGKRKVQQLKSAVLRSPAVLGAAAGPAGSSSVTSSIFNLGKTILGAGVLSLPFGVAVFADSKQGLYPASALLVLMGLMSAYSFYSIGKACDTHHVRTFADAWAKSVDPKTSGALTFVILFKTFFACLAYSIIAGDSFSQIFQTFHVPAAYAHRCPVILSLTTLVLLPLCCLRQLDALKYTSALGLGGIIYCAIFMAIRYFDGSYAKGGQFALDIAENLRPSFNQRTESIVSKPPPSSLTPPSSLLPSTASSLFLFLFQCSGTR